MIKTLFVSVVFSLIFSSCSEVAQRQPLVISIDPWIGSAPFYYAHAKGWLAEANIQLILAPSISENLRIFESGASDMFTSTQHEFFRERKTHPDLIPIIHYDCSFGGDVIMANRSNQQFQDSNEMIDLYLEADTVNEDMAKYWINDNNISKERLRVHARPQDEIVKMVSDINSSPMVVVTYNPHNLLLKKHGFTEIASTKNNRYLVIDVVSISSKLYHKNIQTLAKLNDAYKRAIQVYETNPREFYEKVKPYFANPSYDEFVVMKQNIQWLKGAPSAELSKKMEMIRFPTKDLIL